MGGLGHGPRLGGAGRVGFGEANRFLSFQRRVRRRIQEGVAAMGKQKQVGFVTMGAATGGKKIKDIGVGMLGYAFMGKAHSNAYRKIQYMTWPPPLMPRLVAICGRDETAVAEAARRYGYESYTTDWKRLVRDDRIQLFDNGAPNN